MPDRSDDYLRLVRVVSSLLYAYDPEGMGLTASAPQDEYDDAAARLVVHLAEMDSDQETTNYLVGMYPDAGAGFIDGIAAAVELFLNRPGPATNSG